MNPFANDILNGFNVDQLFRPAARAATANGTGVDCKDYDGPLTAIAEYGTCTDGNYLFSLEESLDDSTYTAITPIDGSFTTITSSNDESKDVVQFKRTKRYVRGVITETSAGATGVVCALQIIGRKKNI